MVKLKDKQEYYITKTTSGVIPGGSPAPDEETGADSERKWGWFGAQFDSVATGLLFAEDASIGGWNLKDNHFISQNGLVEMDGNQNSIYLSKRIYLDQNGLALYENTVDPDRREDGNIKAEISLKDIEESLDLGINTEERIPTFQSVSLREGIIYGVSSGQPAESQVYNASTGAIEMSEVLPVGARTKAYIKGLKTDIVLKFREISSSAKGQSFAIRDLRLIPVVNGKRRTDIFLYNEVPLSLPFQSSQVDIPISFTCPDLESFVSTQKMTLGFELSLVNLPGIGSVKLSATLSTKVENIILETESERKTLIAPNGFYCYGGNMNLVWVTPDRIEIKGGQGPVVSSGKYALKICPDGFFISKHFMDGDNKNWKPIFTDGDQIISSGDRAFKVASDGFYYCTNFTSGNPFWIKASL